VVKHDTPRRLGKILLVLGLFAGAMLSAPQSRGQPIQPPGSAPPVVAVPPAPDEPSLLRLSRNVPGDSSPIRVAADEVATWGEKGRRYVLLRGNVLVQHGPVRVRSQSAAVILDIDGQQRRGIMRVDVYSAGDVKLETDQGIRSGPEGLIELNTRGEVQVKSHAKKVLREPVMSDPIFQRAVEALGMYASPIVPPAGPDVQRTGLKEPTPPPVPLPGSSPVPTPAPQSPYNQQSQPAPVPPLPPVQTPPPAPAPPPAQIAPPQGGIQQTQATLPAPATGPEGPPTRLPGPSLLGPPPPPGSAPMRQYSVAPRTGGALQARSEVLPTGEQATVFTGGVILSVRGVDGIGFLDIEADQALVWSRGGLAQQMLDNLRSPQGAASKELEFYLAGNVEIRQGNVDGTRVLHACEIYYDVNRNAAIAIKADVEFHRIGYPDPIHFRAQEMRQLSADKFEIDKAELFSSKLPSDPGFKIYLASAVVEEKKVPRRSIFGRQFYDRKTGAPMTETQRIVTARNAVFKLEDFPVLYTPYLQADANDPLGPIEGFTVGANRIYGFQIGTSLDVFDLLAIDPAPFTRWRLDLDYLSRRGPGIGTAYDYRYDEWLTLPAQNVGMVRAWGLRDAGSDILGGPRPEAETHPDYRGRFLWRQNVQELPYNFTFQSQLAALSDRNFLEQYFKLEFDNDVNQNTYTYVKQDLGQFAWTGLVEQRMRSWVNETNWLPRVDGYALGLSFFDLFTYSAHASAGYGQLMITNDNLPLVSPLTDVQNSTARLDLRQEVGLPFYLGPVKVVPYGLLDLTYYSNALNGSDDGRIYGGAGLRSSLPLSRLYADAHSDYFNVSGLYHKIVLGSNYFYAESSDPYTMYAQLDRLHDDASDQALRDIRPLYQAGTPTQMFLASSPLFDPQTYAIRRLLDNRVDTVDDIQVLQLDLRQRLQTKRGLPGNQHVIDWMTLDMSVSLFPNGNRDNFGKSFSFLEYDYVWNIGDRTSLVSTGWYDPFDNGPRMYTVGAFLNRPDRTTFYLGYRQIDPVQSRAVSGTVGYVFSPKYSMVGGVSYDFGLGQSLANSVVFTRTGTDLQVSVGFTYYPLQNNFGVTFEILPNLVGQSRRGSPTGLGVGSAMMNR